jgi:hypothetical protein
MTAEDVAVRDPPLLDGVLESPGDMFLPDYFRKFLRAVLPGENLIAHGNEMSRLYVMDRTTSPAEQNGDKRLFDKRLA